MCKNDIIVVTSSPMEVNTRLPITNYSCVTDIKGLEAWEYGAYYAGRILVDNSGNTINCDVLAVARNEKEFKALNYRELIEEYKRKINA